MEEPRSYHTLTHDQILRVIFCSLLARIADNIEVVVKYTDWLAVARMQLCDASVREFAVTCHWHALRDDKADCAEISAGPNVCHAHSVQDSWATDESLNPKTLNDRS